MDLNVLRTAGHEEAAAFFADADPEALVAAVSATGDDELLALIGRDEIRPAAIEGILGRLHEYAVPDRLALLHGTVRIDLERRGRLLERHGLRFAGGEIELLPHLSGQEPVDVVLRTSILRFVRLVSGERNAGLEYLSGKLDIEGDHALVTREVDGGLQTIKVKMPAIVTVDLRLNEPRYASLPNIMKAKKKPLDEKTAADYGVDVTPRLEVVKTEEPAARAAGIIVGSVDELVAKLKEAGAV